MDIIMQIINALAIGALVTAIVPIATEMFSAVMAWLMALFVPV